MNQVNAEALVDLPRFQPFARAGGVHPSHSLRFSILLPGWTIGLLIHRVCTPSRERDD